MRNLLRQLSVYRDARASDGFDVALLDRVGVVIEASDIAVDAADGRRQKAQRLNLILGVGIALIALALAAS